MGEQVIPVQIESVVKSQGTTLETNLQTLQLIVNQLEKPANGEITDVSYERGVTFQPQQYASIVVKVGISLPAKSSQSVQAFHICKQFVEQILETEMQDALTKFRTHIQNLR